MRRAILDRMAELGLTQQQLARLVGVSHSTLSGYVHGSTTPSLPVALRMAQVLGVCTDELFADLARPRRGSNCPSGRSAPRGAGPAPGA